MVCRWSHQALFVIIHLSLCFLETLSGYSGLQRWPGEGDKSRTFFSLGVSADFSIHKWECAKLSWALRQHTPGKGTHRSERRGRKMEKKSKCKCSLEVEKQGLFPLLHCFQRSLLVAAAVQRERFSGSFGGNLSPYRFSWRALCKCVCVDCCVAGQPSAGQCDGSVQHQPLPGGCAAS